MPCVMHNYVYHVTIAIEYHRANFISPDVPSLSYVCAVEGKSLRIFWQDLCPAAETPLMKTSI